MAECAHSFSFAPMFSRGGFVEISTKPPLKMRERSKINPYGDFKLTPKGGMKLSCREIIDKWVYQRLLPRQFVDLVVRQIKLLLILSAHH